MANEEKYNLTMPVSEIDAALIAAKSAVTHEPQTLTPEKQAQARKNLGLDSALLTTLDLTAYGTDVTIADTIQILVLQGGGTAEVSGVGSLWEDVAVQSPLAATFPFDNYTVRSASVTTMAAGDYTIQICFGAICYHLELGVVDVSVVINISGADSATVMVFLITPGPDREDLVAELVPAVIAALPKYNGEVVEQ